MIKMLIVDDQEDIRQLLRLATAGMVAEVYEAKDGHEALALWEQVQPDIVLLDVMMPGGLSGFDVCRAIRARGGVQPKIMIISARERLDHHYEGFEAGADEYLTKPFKLLTLVSGIEKMVQELQRTQR